MGYYRNYIKPYYYRHRRYKKYKEPFGSFEGIFIIGVVFVLVLLISTVSFAITNLIPVLEKILILGLILGGIIWLIRKLTSQPKNDKLDNLYIPAYATKDQIAKINSEKHGCKCYMDGLTDGEQEIAHILAEGLNYKDYFIFNNLTIPSDHNGSSQIDHLVVSRFGIFVIESKDYNGWIFGGKDQEHWTQSLYKARPGGKNKFQFHNPIKQNWSHIVSLKLLMPSIPENVYQSIVVFTDSCEFKTDPIENVVHSKDVVICIQKYTEVKLSENTLHIILGKLSYVCQTADISHEQHLENLHAKYPKLEIQ